MSAFVEIVVAAAAIVFLLERAKIAAEALIDTIVKHSLRRLDALHKETRAEIRPTFDLWWEDGPKQRALQKMREKLPDHGDGLSDENLETLMTMPLIELKSAAWHLAIHAYMGTQEADLIAKLPKIGGIRERMIASRQSHEGDLDEASGGLVDFGINPGELREHFSPSR